MTRISRFLQLTPYSFSIKTLITPFTNPNNNYDTEPERPSSFFRWGGGGGGGGSGGGGSGGMGYVENWTPLEHSSKYFLFNSFFKFNFHSFVLQTPTSTTSTHGWHKSRGQRFSSGRLCGRKLRKINQYHVDIDGSNLDYSILLYILLASTDLGAVAESYLSLNWRRRIFDVHFNSISM